jgi:hypothetical protein
MRSRSILRGAGARLVRGSLCALALLTVSGHSLSAQDTKMNFFVAPSGPSYGQTQPALRVSDQHCADLAYPLGFGHLRWAAYLDGAAADGEGGQVARSRIGPGPFINHYGVVVAENVAQLHSDANNLNAETAVTVNGDYAPDGFLIPKGSEMDGSDFTRRGPFFCFGFP